jgi:hypothetical protein
LSPGFIQSDLEKDVETSSIGGMLGSKKKKKKRRHRTIFTSFQLEELVTHSANPNYTCNANPA